MHDPSAADCSARADGAAGFKALIESSTDAFVLLDPDGTLRYASPSAARMLGYTLDEILTLNLLSLVHPDDLGRTEAALVELVAADGASAALTCRVRHRDGSWRWVEGAGTNLLGDPAVRALVAGYRDVTERRSAETALQESAERFQLLSRATNDVLWDWDLTSNALWVSEGMRTTFGYAPEELRPEIDTWYEHIHPEDRQRVIAGLHAAIAEGGSTWSDNYRYLRADGSTAFVHDRGYVLRDASGAAVRMVGGIQDLSERAELEAAWRASEARYRMLIERIPAMVYHIPLDTSEPTIFVSSQIEPVLGYSPAEFTARPELWESILHPEDRETVLSRVALAQQGRRPLHGEYRLIARNGHTIWVQDQADFVRDEDGVPRYLLGVMFDITERKHLEAQLSRQAFYDPLTDLPNRALFLDRLSQTLAGLARNDDHHAVAVLMLDLDGFKVVNDSLGHNAGDELLQLVAVRLSRCLAPGDTLARLGGDEFSVLLQHVSHPADAARFADCLLAGLERPFEFSGREVVASASIGIAVTAQPMTAPEELLRQADIALFAAKDAGKARAAIFDSQMSARAVERLELEGELRRAIGGGELVLYYQPHVDLATGTIAGAEALVRWRHPERGLLYPGEFIPLAEETGLILDLDRWVLRTACRQAMTWTPAERRPPLLVSVNLSARLLAEADLVERVRAALAESGLPPALLQLEITESAMMADPDAAEERLHALKSLGVRLAIDDFGTGYSSLAYLHRFPIDTVKVDRAFVCDLDNPRTARLLNAVKLMADALGMDVTAEGIETARQRDLLTALRYDHGQGFLFGRAAPPEVLSAHLRGSRHEQQAAG